MDSRYVGRKDARRISKEGKHFWHHAKRLSTHGARNKVGKEEQLRVWGPNDFLDTGPCGQEQELKVTILRTTYFVFLSYPMLVDEHFCGLEIQPGHPRDQNSYVYDDARALHSANSVRSLAPIHYGGERVREA